MDLPILEKVYELTLWVYPLVNKFPKSQRFVLGQRIENTLIDIITQIIEVKISGKKRSKLEKISTDLDKLRFLIRLSKDLRMINIKKYGIASEKINEIGKMLGGWIKSCK